MKKLATLMLLLSSYPLTGLATSPADALAKQLAQHITLSGKFTQKTYDEQGMLLQRGYGEFIWSQPGRFVWKTTAPSQHAIIADGKQLWLIDYELKQVIHQDLRASSLQNPATLLTSDATKLQQHFKISSHQANHYTLTPKRIEQISQIEISFHHNSLNKLCYQDPLSQTTCLQFSHLTQPRQIPPATFQYTIPDGYDQIEQ